MHAFDPQRPGKGDRRIGDLPRAHSRRERRAAALFRHGRLLINLPAVAVDIPPTPLCSSWHERCVVLQVVLVEIRGPSRTPRICRTLWSSETRQRGVRKKNSRISTGHSRLIDFDIAGRSRPACRSGNPGSSRAQVMTWTLSTPAASRDIPRSCSGASWRHSAIAG